MALTHQWISFNTRDYFNALTIDCDDNDWPHYLKRLREQGEADPTLITVSPSTGTAHLTWWLAPYHGHGISKGNRKQMRLYDGVYEGLRAALGGDPNFKQYLAKNPLHDAYEVVLFTGKEHQLSDLLGPLIEWSGEKDFVLAPRIRAQFEGRKPGISAIPQNLQDVAGTKGSRVWEIGSRRCHRQRSADVTVITGILEDVAAELGSPIKAKALAGMAHRISKWMAARPEMLGTPAADLRDIDHGVMTREARERGQSADWNKLDTTSKRILAAERTNAIRETQTESAVTTEIIRRWKASEPITQEALAKAADVGIRRIKQIWSSTRINPKGDLRSTPFSPCLGALGDGLLKESPSLTLKQISILSKERHRASEALKKMDDMLIRKYQAHEAEMRKRGVTPERPPMLADPRTASPEVLAAYKSALAATRDAERRQQQRADKVHYQQKADERRAQFRNWAKTGDIDAFTAWIRQQEVRWDGIEGGKEGEERERIGVQRRSVFKSFWRDWRQALAEFNTAMPPRPPRRFRTTNDNLDRIALSRPFEKRGGNHLQPGTYTNAEPPYAISNHVPRPLIPSFLKQ